MASSTKGPVIKRAFVLSWCLHYNGAPIRASVWEWASLIGILDITTERDYRFPHRSRCKHSGNYKPPLKSWKVYKFDFRKTRQSVSFETLEEGLGRAAKLMRPTCLFLPATLASNSTILSISNELAKLQTSGNESPSSTCNSIPRTSVNPVFS